MSLKKVKIDPERWYTLSALVESKLFPWFGEDLRLYRNIVSRDMKGPNHLKTLTIGEGKRKRYRFKGEHIISFIEKVEKGSVRL